MEQKFLIKFFPPSKMSQQRAEITQFHQFDYEQLYEACERLKEMLREYPQYGIEDWLFVQLFYNWLNGPMESHIDASSGENYLVQSTGWSTKAIWRHLHE